jgi:hypothetical protein
VDQPAVNTLGPQRIKSGVQRSDVRQTKGESETAPQREKVPIHIAEDPDPTG